ncbi:synaptopodin 2-like protein [Clinocottus analis]|uniref:synaptopodin 2-like protein n=1 Tax=Clinocottus analis TaxID=304258 RepID=UPI0035C04725
MVAEEIEVSLSGGSPWGFRLQGGAEQQKPLQVAKVRRRSKACRAGLKELDELVAIGDHMCAELSHAQAMSLIDMESTTLNLRVKRGPSGSHSSSYSGCSAPLRSCMRVMSPPVAPSPAQRSSVLSPTGLPRGITSPPDSEAYYGETDSDADTQSLTHRRQRRTPPHTRSPARHDNQEEEEASEMSGYESATDPGVSMQGQWEVQCLPGVPRRELIYQPPQTEWTTPAHIPLTVTPHTLTPTPDQGSMETEGEGDSGFQEAGGCGGMSCPPLVSPERAKDALLSAAGKHLVPMVGPQQTPISDELSTTYKDKARQAKLQRGESVVEKQVKEARTKCRSIASLLTDAPNPNSKGVLMFKKRRQRAKKYTLTCFGKAEGDRGGETEGDTGGETEEEGGSSALSGSEVDEEGFSASFDPTWDTGYLDLLDRRSSACPSSTPATPTTPTANHSPGLDISAYQTLGLSTSVNQSPGLDISAYQTPGPSTSVNHSPGLEITGLDSSAYQGSRLESSVRKQPISNHMSPPAVALTNGGSMSVSRASVVLNPPSQMTLPSQNGQHGNPSSSPNPNPCASPITDSDHLLNPGVLNRTARPFTPGPSSRASVTSVMFRPPQPKPTPVAMPTAPVAAVSMVTIQPTLHPPGPDAKRAVSSTSLYIPPRNNNGSVAPSVNSPPSSLSSAPLSHPATHPPTFSPQPAVYASPSVPFSPPAAQGNLFCPSPAQPFSPPAPQAFSSPPAPYPPPSTYISASPIFPPHAPDLTQPSFHAQPAPLLPPPPTQPSPSPSVHPYVNMTGQVTPGPYAAATASLPQDSLATREERISVPAARTGILHDARRRGNKKPMFCAVQNKDISPNPDLLSMVQNMDDHFGGSGSRGPQPTPSAETGAVPSGETGHESGPEEDWLRLGAEACNFMQAQRRPRPPPVAPKPQTPQVPQLAGKGGELFARRQNRMDRYIVERSPSVAAAPYSPAQTRESSPTPSLPATWKYSSSIRAPPPISYNPLLSPSCPLKAQKKCEVAKSGPAVPKGKKAALKAVDIMSHQPYQLNSSLFSYGGGVPMNTSTYQQQKGPQKTARVYEVKRFSTPPPTSTGPALKVIVPRSATTLGEPLWYSDVTSPPPTVGHAPHQPYQPQPFQPQWATSPLSPPPPPAPTAPLPQLPTFSAAPASILVQSPTFTHLQSSNTPQANRQFKSAPDLSPVGPGGSSRSASSSSQPNRGPRPRFSTSNMGLQPCVWRPGSTAH